MVGASTLFFLYKPQRLSDDNRSKNRYKHVDYWTRYQMSRSFGGSSDVITAGHVLVFCRYVIVERKVNGFVLNEHEEIFFDLTTV